MYVIYNCHFTQVPVTMKLIALFALLCVVYVSCQYRKQGHVGRYRNRVAGGYRNRGGYGRLGLGNSYLLNGYGSVGLYAPRANYVASPYSSYYRPSILGNRRPFRLLSGTSYKLY